MLKQKTWILVPVLTLLLLLTAIPSQAAPIASSAVRADGTSSLLDKLAHWLDFLAGDAKVRAPRARAHHVTILQKHGCGIDPQGEPYCTPD
ncbi:MAG: hypothetical protein WAM82_25505 [Thermoanaerobaculia bacterium]